VKRVNYNRSRCESMHFLHFFTQTHHVTQVNEALQMIVIE